MENGKTNKNNAKCELKNEYLPKLKYRDHFYGKRRITCVLVLIASIFVWKATTIVLAISSLYKHPMEITDIYYSADRPTNILVKFRIKDFNSPLSLKFKHMKVLLGDRTKIEVGNISIQRGSEISVESSINLASIDLCNLDINNFNFTLELGAETNFCFIPMMFIVKAQKHIRIKSTKKLDKAFMKNLFNFEFSQNDPKRILLKISKDEIGNLVGDKTNIDLSFKDTEIVTEPKIFEEIKLKGGSIKNSPGLIGYLTIVITLSDSNEAFGKYLQDLIRESKGFVIKELKTPDKTIPINFDLFYSETPKEEKEFRDFFMSVTEFDVSEKLKFVTQFGENSELDDLIFYAGLFLGETKLNFIGSVNQQAICEITTGVAEQKILVEIDVLDFDQLIRPMLYREPMVAFEIDNNQGIFTTLLKDIKFITNYTTDYQIYYKNSVAPILVKSHSFMKNISLKHEIKEVEHLLPNRNPDITIHSTVEFRNKSQVTSKTDESLSTFITIDFPEDITLNIESSKLSGSVTFKKTDLYFDMILDAFNNRMYGIIKLDSKITLKPAVFNEIKASPTKNVILDLLGDDLKVFHEKWNDTGFSFKNFLVDTPIFYGESDNLITQSNYLDKSLYFPYEREEMDIQFYMPRFLAKYVDFDHLLKIKFNLSSVEDEHFNAFYARKYPNKNHKMLISNQITFPAGSADFISPSSGKVASISAGFSTINIFMLDDYLIFEIPNPILIEATIHSLGLSDSHVDPNQRSYFSAAAANFLLYLVTSESKNKTKATLCDYKDNYSLFTDVFEEGDQFCVEAKLKIPDKILRNTKNLVFDFPHKFSCVGTKSDFQTAFVKFELDWQNKKIYSEATVKFSILAKEEELTNDFDVVFQTKIQGIIKNSQNPVKASELISFMNDNCPKTLPEYYSNAKTENLKAILTNISQTSSTSNETKVKASLHFELENLIDSLGQLIPSIVGCEFLPKTIDFSLNLKISPVVQIKSVGIEILVYDLNVKTQIKQSISYPPDKYEVTQENRLKEITDQNKIQFYVLNNRRTLSTSSSDFVFIEEPFPQVKYTNPVNDEKLVLFRYTTLKKDEKDVYFLPSPNTVVTIRIKFSNYNPADNNETSIDAPLCFGLSNFFDLDKRFANPLSAVIGIWKNPSGLMSLMLKLPIDCFIDPSLKRENTGITSLIFYLHNFSKAIFISFNDSLTDYSLRHLGYNLMIPIYWADVPRTIKNQLNDKDTVLLDVNGKLFDFESEFNISIGDKANYFIYFFSTNMFINATNLVKIWQEREELHYGLNDYLRSVYGLPSLNRGMIASLVTTFMREPSSRSAEISITKRLINMPDESLTDYFRNVIALRQFEAMVPSLESDQESNDNQGNELSDVEGSDVEGSDDENDDFRSAYNTSPEERFYSCEQESSEQGLAGVSN